MNYTLTDYQRAVDGFLDDLRPLGQDLRAVLLFGSLARGDVRPGKSDLLDACLVLRSDVGLGRGRFLEALRVFVSAAEHLRQTGLPTHPFFFYFEHELAHIPAIWLSLWGSDDTSRVLFGEDLRPRLTSTDESKLVARTSVFQFRQVAHRLGRFLHKESLSEQDCEEIIEQLATLNKFFPLMACLMLGNWIEQLATLKKFFPRTACLVLGNWITEAHGAEEIGKTLLGVETEVLPRIMSFRDHPPERSDLQSWRSIITDFLRFIEQVHAALPDERSVS